MRTKFFLLFLFAFDESEHVLSDPPGAVPIVRATLQSSTSGFFGLDLCLELLQFLPP